MGYATDSKNPAGSKVLIVAADRISIRISHGILQRETFIIERA